MSRRARQRVHVGCRSRLCRARSRRRVVASSRRRVVASSRRRVVVTGGVLHVTEARSGVKAEGDESLLLASCRDQGTPIAWLSKEGQLQVILDRLPVNGITGERMRIALLVAHDQLERSVSPLR